MPNSELGTICAQQVSSCSEVIRRWLVAFGELYRQEITPALVGTWEMLLADVPPDILDRACQQGAKTVKFFPTPADVRSQIAAADAAGLRLEVEQKWQRYLAWLRECYDPNLGVGRGAPPLEPAVGLAARAAGGHRWIERCQEPELQWARKRFIEAYTNVSELGQVEHLLSVGEAKRILRRLAVVPESPSQKTLTPAAPVNAPAPSEPRATNQAEPRSAPAPLGPQELEDRKRRELARFTRHLQEHPELQAALDAREAMPDPGSKNGESEAR